VITVFCEKVASIDDFANYLSFFNRSKSAKKPSFPFHRQCQRLLLPRFGKLPRPFLEKCQQLSAAFFRL
jgi:hypothetical protein